MPLNTKYLGHTSDPPSTDGTQGYVSIKLTLKKKYQTTRIIRTIGYLVKADSNFNKYLGIPSNFICKDPGILIYFYCNEQDWKRKLQGFKIRVHRFNKAKEKEATISRKTVDSETLSEREPHLFIPIACDEKLTTTVFVRDFAHPYSQSLSVSNEFISDSDYKGVQKDKNSNPTYVEFKLTKCKPDNNNDFYMKTNDVFENLDDGPLLCQDGDHLNLVGWYEKDLQQSNRILLHHLRRQGQ